MNFKDYQILNKLGAGSFGIVFKAKRKDNGQICVIKQVALKAMDRKMKQWAMNEVKIMKTINCQYIVQYLHSFIEKEKLYICMEYCSGGDLAQFMKGQMGKPLAQDTVWKFSLQIMLGLRQLHKKKILHRDIKTMNIFITHNKEIRIGDLGVARTLTGDFANTVVGTPYYLSPEMCEEKPYNEKTDVWAMGCLIYELCTGRHPFEGNSQAALALKIVVGKYTPIPAHYSQVTSWVIKSCLSVDYKRRPTIHYILSQPDVIKMANKLNISLEPPKQELEKVEIKVKELAPKPAEKVVRGQIKQNTPKIGDIKVVPKKNHPPREPERKPSVERNKSRSMEKFNKSGQRNNRSIDKNKPYNAVQAAKRPNLVPGMPRVMPKKSNGFEAKKPDPKLREPTSKEKDSKQVQAKVIKEKVIEPKKAIQVVKQPQKIQSKSNPTSLEAKKEESPKLQSAPTLLDKPRKSAQAIVDDDELFKDFGITPEKLVVIEQKVQFKKVNNIDWNIGDESQAKTQQKTNQKTIFKELPTIRTDSNCGLVEVECQQIEDEQDGVAQQIDDNNPYDSNQQICIDEPEEEQSLLIEPEKNIQEDDQLKRREKLLLLQKRIFENEKRKKELVSLKEQGEKQLLVKMDKSKFDKIINILNQGTDEDLQKIVHKQLNSAGGASKFYKIFYWQMEITRCDQNIGKCVENIKSIAEK